VRAFDLPHASVVFAPLTKLGDPRSDSAFRFPFIKTVNLNAS